jgi:hypothetical protein
MEKERSEAEKCPGPDMGLSERIVHFIVSTIMEIDQK